MTRGIMNHKKRGMTLVELLIVVAIVAVLASVALPSWNSQVQKARRADARNTLMFVQVEQEKYRADNGSYASDMSALGLSTYTPLHVITTTCRLSRAVRLLSSQVLVQTPMVGKTAIVVGPLPLINPGQTTREATHQSQTVGDAAIPHLCLHRAASMYWSFEPPPTSRLMTTRFTEAHAKGLTPSTVVIMCDSTHRTSSR
jgi:prepilin-type N-terminal cleavage/methylation domain-containing protein